MNYKRQAYKILRQISEKTKGRLPFLVLTLRGVYFLIKIWFLLKG